MISLDGKPPATEVLVNLFPRDSGEDVLTSPTSSSEAAFSKLNLRPFRWCQWLCGLYTSAKGSCPVFDQHTAVESIIPPPRVEPSTGAVIRRIGERVRSYNAMEKLLEDLPASAKSFTPHPDVSDLFWASTTTQLDSFTPLDGWTASMGRNALTVLQRSASVSSASSALGDVEEGEDGEVGDPKGKGKLSKEPDGRVGYRYFEASFKRDKAKMSAIVEISPEYPDRVPIFHLQTGLTDATKFDTDMVNIEAEVNLHFLEMMGDSEECADLILRHQIWRLQMCFDILEGQKSEAKENVSRRRRGFDRRLAFMIEERNSAPTHR